MFSFVVPLDNNRLELFKNSKRLYDESPTVSEFIIPTRDELIVARYLDDNKLSTGVKLIPYTLDTPGFNCSKALNLGVRNAKYDSIIITSPEVRPISNVLKQFSKLVGKNVIAQVFDLDEKGEITMSLVNFGYRSQNPAMYFLAMFNKADIQKINGWDEDFMLGYAYEDDDFGSRWLRAELAFEVHDEIQAEHQYHQRLETIAGGTDINHNKFNDNNTRGIVQAPNGLYNLD